MVSLCDEESKRASPASSADRKAPLSNKHTKTCKMYIEKGAELTLKVHSIATAPMPALQVASDDRLTCQLPFLGPQLRIVRAHLSLQGKFEDAEWYLTAALGEASKGFGIDDPDTAIARMQLAEHYKYRHQYELAVPLYVR